MEALKWTRKWIRYLRGRTGNTVNGIGFEYLIVVVFAEIVKTSAIQVRGEKSTPLFCTS